MNLQQRVSISRRISLLSYSALLLSLVTGWFVNGPSIDRIEILLIQTIPLLVFLPGMLRGKSMVFLYMSCVLLLYVTMSVTNLMLGKQLLFSIIESIASVTLFTATMLFVRYSRQLRQQQADAAS